MITNKYDYLLDILMSAEKNLIKKIDKIFYNKGDEDIPPRFNNDVINFFKIHNVKEVILQKYLLSSSEIKKIINYYLSDELSSIKFSCKYYKHAKTEIFRLDEIILLSIFFHAVDVRKTIKTSVDYSMYLPLILGYYRSDNTFFILRKIFLLTLSFFSIVGFFPMLNQLLHLYFKSEVFIMNFNIALVGSILFFIVFFWSSGSIYFRSKPICNYPSSKEILIHSGSDASGIVHDIMEHYSKVRK